MSTEPLLLPPPRRVETGPARTHSEAPNTLLGDASPRLERAFERLPPMGVEVRFEVAPTPASTPGLQPDAASEIEFADAMTVRAASEWGAIHSLATIAQLAGRSHAITRIHDHPAYPWRGLMIDVARHFIPLPTLRRTLDAMSLAKLNVLHLHLTDDQAFRFRSEAHPELASTEAWDAAELTELVAYAADRAIRIVPELDMPGHVTSWLVARPEWGAGAASGSSRRFGVHEACLDPTNPAVLRAVETLLGELADIFPDPFLHFGGDEVNGTWWHAHEGVQALMRSQGFKTADVQADFNRKLTTIIRHLGRRPLAWDEALHPGLARDTVIQAWRGNQARDTALAAGFDCVLSAPYYLDLFYPAALHHCFDPRRRPRRSPGPPARRRPHKACAGWPAMDGWVRELSRIAGRTCRRGKGEFSAARLACGRNWWTRVASTVDFGAGFRPSPSDSGAVLRPRRRDSSNARRRSGRAWRGRGSCQRTQRLAGGRFPNSRPSSRWWKCWNR